MTSGRFFRRRTAREDRIAVGDPRLQDWQTVATFQDSGTAVAWRDQLRALGVDAACTADAPPDRFGRGEIYLVVPPDQWSRATEIIENLD